MPVHQGPNPVLVPVPERELYRLDNNWYYNVGEYRFIIEKGFEYDGASIPAWAWRATYSPFNPIVMTAALMHDHLCILQPQMVNYIAAADHFRDNLVHANPTKRALMHRAVLIGGPRWGVK